MQNFISFLSFYFQFYSFSSKSIRLQINRSSTVMATFESADRNIFSMLYIFWEIYKDYLNAILDLHTDADEKKN